MLKIFVFLATILTIIQLVHSLPERPQFPVQEICEAYKEKCFSKFNRNDCAARAEECVKYAEQGLRTTWSFCLFANNYDEVVCRERSQIDFQIIQNWIGKDEFKWIPE